MSGNKGSGFKVAVVLVVIAIIIAFAVNSLAGKKAQTTSDLDIYVKDETGNTISDETKKIVLAQNKILEEEYGGAQLMVAVVQTTGKENIRIYSKQYFNDKGIGSATNNNGLLLLISVDEQDYYTTYGSGLEDNFAGELAVALYYYMEPEFAKGNIDKAVATAVPELSKSLQAACAQWNTVATIPTEAPVATVTPLPGETVTQEPEIEITLPPDFLDNYEDYVYEHTSGINAISIFAYGIGTVIRLVFKLIFGLFSSVSIGFIVVVCIFVSLINSGSKRSRRSGGVYFRNVPPSEPFDHGPGYSGPTHRSSSFGSGPVRRSSSTHRTGSFGSSSGHGAGSFGSGPMHHSGPASHSGSSFGTRSGGSTGHGFGSSSGRSTGSSAGHSFGGSSGRSSGSSTGHSPGGPSGRFGGGHTSGGGAGRNR